MEPYKLPHVIDHSALLVESYRRWTGWELVGGRDLAYALFYAPFAIIAHGTQDDPLVEYANQAALDVWETDWAAFIGIPSRLSAAPKPEIQDPRSRVLAEVLEKGWSVNYNGERVSRTGTRFEIINTVVWNATDETGHRHGQAARIGTWRYL